MLICPKCQGEMRTYERNGVLIDQCDDCRGIFLDRGEIERLIDAAVPPADHKIGPDRRHRGSPEGKSRANASAVIADLLVLLASEPQSVHQTGRRSARKRPGE